jgi:two-component system, chemotaxis family, protein-glutamate methylesterase/glutaminase
VAIRDIIVVGGSAGSSAVLAQLISDLPADLPAAVFVTTHVPVQSSAYLVDVLARNAALPIVQAVDGQPIEPGRVYVATPDCHLLLIGGAIRMGMGPRENMARPAIDPMFRSAALSYGPRVIGVVLTGKLNDGASGLHAIKARGGLAVVQHPVDAQESEMPLSALQAADADHVASAEQLGALIVSLAGTPASPAAEPGDGLRLEVEIALGRRLGSDQMLRIANPSAISCPECGGVLSEIREGHPLRYRCQIGHAYTGEVLATQHEEIDEAIRVAMRIMEERVTLVERMARDARDSGRSAVAELYDARAEEYRRYAATLREAATAALRPASTASAQNM